MLSVYEVTIRLCGLGFEGLAISVIEHQRTVQRKANIHDLVTGQ